MLTISTEYASFDCMCNCELIRQQLNELEQDVDLLTSTKITHLNEDCLTTIFGYLELSDVVNVADASKQFSNSVCRVYRKKYIKVNPIFDESERHFR